MKNDDESQALLASMVGRTITAAEFDDYGHDDGMGDRYVLTLDDGRRIEFAGWGHDYWGTHIDLAD